MASKKRLPNRKIGSNIFGSSLLATSLLLSTNLAANAKDYCGPDDNAFMSWITNAYLSPFDKIFNPLCKEHDENYSLVNKRSNTSMSQERADQIFRTGLYRACSNDWRKAIKGTWRDNDIYYGWTQLWTNGNYASYIKSWCRDLADDAYSMVSEFGSDIAAVKGFPSLKVTKARIFREDDYWSDDEIKVDFTVVNDGYVNIEVDAVMMKKGKGYKNLLNPSVFSRVASALDRSVLPVPGGPTKRTPLGILAPISVYLCGFLRKSTISVSSSFASSTPATSSNVILDSSSGT